jgi:polysaccharide biosynthesis transport protein
MEQLDLATWLQIARRRAWIVVASVALAFAAAWGVTQLIAPRYEATAMLFVAGNTPSGEPALDIQYAALAQGLVTSYAKLAETGVVTAAAARELGVPASDLEGHVEAIFQPGEQILRLSAQSTSPTQAAQIANAVAGALAARVDDLAGPGSNPVGVQLIDPAEPPAQPVSPRPFLNLVLAGVLGLLVGIAVALGWERLDTRIRTVADAERELGLPVLGTIPRLRRRLLRREALARHANQDIAERHRSLAVTLATQIRRHGHRSIVLTSAAASEGKTTVASHLALALAEDNHEVALIEGDLRRPSLRRHFRQHTAPTLDDILSDDCGLPASTTVCPRLKVVSAAESSAHAGSILRAPEFGQMLARAAENANTVIIDAPPALAVSDVGVLTRHADTIVLVVRAGSTRPDDARTALVGLKRLGAPIAGAVLVGARNSRLNRYYGAPTNGFKPAQLEDLQPINN